MSKTLLRSSLFLLVLVITLFVLLDKCEGYSSKVISDQKQQPFRLLAKTFDNKEGDQLIKLKRWGDLDYTAVSIVLWPVILICLSAVVIPTALLMVVIFVIPVITPPEASGGERRGLSSSLWNSLYLTQGILTGAEECVERISCELAKVANKYSYPLANRIQDRIANAAVLSPTTKSRLSRSFEVAAGLGRSEGCVKFQCEPWKSISSSNPLGFSDSLQLGKYFGNYFNNSTETILGNLFPPLENRLVYRKRKTNARTKVIRVK